MDGKWSAEQRAGVVCARGEWGSDGGCSGVAAQCSQEYGGRRIRPDRLESPAADQTTPDIWVRVRAGPPISRRQRSLDPPDDCQSPQS